MSEFEHRITEDSTEFEKAFLKIYDGNLWTALDKMKDWQPPMPLPKPYIEVPQFVADWFEEKMSGTFSAVIKSYSFDYNEATAWVHDNGGFNLLCKMKLYDYTVEKEKKYILKHIDLSKLYTYDSLYLAHSNFAKLQHVRYSKDVCMSKIKQCHFTQSEIDKLNIGSYEQIEVKVEEVEK